MSPEPPVCDIPGCEKDSKFLLTTGDRCEEHASVDQPETVDYLNWCDKNTDGGADR